MRGEIKETIDALAVKKDGSVSNNCYVGKIIKKTGNRN
jgi:hypothetical protein